MSYQDYDDSGVDYGVQSHNAFAMQVGAVLLLVAIVVIVITVVAG